MRYVVGYAADDQGREALRLAAWLAHKHDADVTVGYVVPEEFPIASRVDKRSSFPPEIRRQVDGWLGEAVQWLAREGGIAADTQVVAARSPGRGLAELATGVGASLIVLGSSRSSALQHFSVGTVSGQLMHSSPVALALAPRGLAIPIDQPVRRVWCGHAGTARSDEALVAATQLARRTGAPLRLVTFVVPDGFGPLDHGDVEQIVRRRRADATTVLAAAEVRAGALLRDTPVGVDTAIVEGHDVDAAFAALAPDPAGPGGDVLVLGSSDAGPLERVFFGGTASRLLRHCPWPVVAVPRGGADVRLDVTAQFPAIRDEVGR